MGLTVDSKKRVATLHVGYQPTRYDIQLRKQLNGRKFLVGKDGKHWKLRIEDWTIKC